MSDSVRGLRILVGTALLLLLIEPGRVPLFEPDEGRYAEIPREMLATCDVVTPRLNVLREAAALLLGRRGVDGRLR